MVKGGRALEWLQRAVVGVFLLAILAGIFVPIYGDEIGWRFQERAALDGVDKLFSDLCGPNTLAVPPFFMMPARYYSAFFNTAFPDPFWVRASGILYALTWSALMLALIGRLARSQADRIALTVIAVGLMSLGMMPMLLVWSRPEQPIILATTAVLFFAWKGHQDRAMETPARTAWLRSTVIVFLATIAVSYHLKALVLAPLFLACLLFASHGHAARVPRLVMSVLLVGIVGWSAHYWLHRLACPDDPVLRAAYAGNNMGIYIASARNLTELIAALGKIIANTDPFQYFGMPVPRPDPLSQWVEQNQISGHDSVLWNRALVMLWWGCFLFASACLAVRGWQLWRARAWDARLVVAAALVVAVAGWSASQSHANVYEAVFALPLMMLAIVFALSANEPGSGLARWTRGLAVIVGVLGLTSMAAVAAIYAPSLVRANRQTAYIAAQRFSQPVFGYGSVKGDILGAARQCGIGDPSRARGLMIDDVTYLAFMQSRRPQHYLGVLGVWRGSITDPMAYLRSRGSSGAILGCHLLPDDLRRRARRQGQFCCLPPP